MGWSEEFKKAGKTVVLETLKKAMADQLNAIGKTAGKTFHTQGARSGRLKANSNRKGRSRISYKSKNTTGRLRIGTGDLKRSIEARGGRRDDSIRNLVIKYDKVMGEIGTNTKSESGFDYPQFHEFGRFPFLRPARLREQPNFYKRFMKHWNKVKTI